MHGAEIEKRAEWDARYRVNFRAFADQIVTMTSAEQLPISNIWVISSHPIQSPAAPTAREEKWEADELPRPPGGYDRVLKRVGIQY